MIFKRYKLFRGLTVICAFLCALLIGLSMIGSVADYKAMINDVLGVSGSFAGNAEAYAYTSDYKDTTELLTRRKEIAEQIGEEGCVLLKNESGALPLTAKDGGNKVTVLGSRAYTYDRAAAPSTDKDKIEKDAKRNLRVTEEKKGDGSPKANSLAFYAGIVGSPIVRQTVTTAEGTISLPVTIEDAFANQGIEINPQMFNFYGDKPYPSPVDGSEANGSSGGPFSSHETKLELSDCGDYRSYSDACFVVIGRMSGEGREYVPGINGVLDKTDGARSALGLSDDERKLIEVANQIAPGKVIVLINSAVAMEIDELKNDPAVNSILWIGLPGSYGMNGVARVISGAASPSGKLSDTYAVDASASPAAQNFGTDAQNGSGSFTWSNGGSYNNADNSHYVVLAEDIYTGYYYYETRYTDCVEGKGNASSATGTGYGEAGSASWNYDKEVSYSFGYGLSYSEFTQEIVADSLTADYENKTVSLDVKVKNNGTKTAKEVIELYVQSPYTQYDIDRGIEKSAIQLVSFEKAELESGEEKTVTLTCDMKYFASYDKTVNHDGHTGGYILESGNYYFAIGNGAHEALNNILSKKGIEESKLYLEDGSSINANGAVLWNPDLQFDADGVNSQLFASSDNGTLVYNRLSDADYNYFNKDTVTYLSRSDWEGTFPKAYTGLTVTSGMYDFLDSKVYKFSVGTVETQFGVDHSEEEDEDGNPMENLSIADMKLAAYDDERWEYLVEEITFDEAWAFSPYGGTYCNSFLSVNAPEVWQIDGPNGNITRGIGVKAVNSGPLAVKSNDPNYNYMSADMCCEPMTAATWNKELLKEQGEIYGENMLWSRNAIIWAPGMNLHRTPFNSRNHEYYSEDAMLSNHLGRAFVEGGLSKGAILAAKHFAFNTQESFREGLCQFMEEQSARELELRAFQGITEDAVFVNSLGNEIGSLGLMTSFSRIGVCGVNAHTGLMKEILRDEWGYKGLSSTDMVVGGRFFNPQDSIMNNVTFMATSNAENLLNNFWKDYSNKSKVKSDPVLCKALSENMHYYMYAIANSSALNGIDANTVITNTLYGWQIAIIIVCCLFGLLTLAGATLCVLMKTVPDLPERIKNRKAKKNNADASGGVE